MARTSPVKSLMIGICLLALSSSVSHATMAVIDAQGLAKATEQINEARKQIAEIQKMKQELEKQLSAIGKAGQIVIPSLNLDKLKRSIRKTVQCSLLSKDDLLRMMPGMKFEDVDIDSVCQGRQLYGNILFGSEKEFKKARTHNDKNALSARIKQRRKNLLEDTTTKGLALADVTIKAAGDVSKSVSELEMAAAAATNQNDRLAVIAKGQLLIARGIAQTNQLLAMMLKLHAADAVINNLSTYSTLKKEEKK